MFNKVGLTIDLTIKKYKSANDTTGDDITTLNDISSLKPKLNIIDRKDIIENKNICLSCNISSFLNKNIVDSISKTNAAYRNNNCALKALPPDKI